MVGLFLAILFVLFNHVFLFPILGVVVIPALFLEILIAPIFGPPSVIMALSWPMILLANFIFPFLVGALIGLIFDLIKLFTKNK